MQQNQILCCLCLDWLVENAFNFSLILIKLGLMQYTSYLCSVFRVILSICSVFKLESACLWPKPHEIESFFLGGWVLVCSHREREREREREVWTCFALWNQKLSLDFGRICKRPGFQNLSLPGIELSGWIQTASQLMLENMLRFLLWAPDKEDLVLD